MNRIIHTISAAMEKPVIAMLILLIALTAVMVGLLLAEFFTEHRHLNITLPALLDELKSNREDRKKVIREANIFPRQKEKLLEILRHPDYSNFMRESLAIRLLGEEQEYYDRRILLSDMIAKIAPILGLLGTLIPLGPGIIALGQGDTVTLSTSLLTAFDTTVVGLICAGVAMVISAIRNQWYRNYSSILETLMECLLELEKKDA